MCEHQRQRVPHLAAGEVSLRAERTSHGWGGAGEVETTRCLTANDALDGSSTGT